MGAKVVGCGFGKTGTTSLHRALQALGYNVRAYSTTLIRLQQRGITLPMRAVAYRYDAFRSHPWSRAYMQMDRWFPGSKFILTTRDTDEWFESLIKHRQRVGHGDPNVDKDMQVAEYEAHTQGVRDYFADRPHQLLEFNVAAGDGWDELCGFLGHPTPDIPYPHAYKAPD